MAEDKFDAVDPLARVSKESALVLYDEDVIEIIPAETEELNLDGPLLDEKSEHRFEEADDAPEGDNFDRTHDPVRLYLREMGSVPLLNREGEEAFRFVKVFSLFWMGKSASMHWAMSVVKSNLHLEKIQTPRCGWQKHSLVPG